MPDSKLWYQQCLETFKTPNYSEAQAFYMNFAKIVTFERKLFKLFIAFERSITSIWLRNPFQKCTLQELLPKGHPHKQSNLIDAEIPLESLHLGVDKLTAV